MTDSLITDECDDRFRRLAAADDASTVNGIDWLEVDPADQRILHVGFLHPLPPAADAVPQGAVLPLSVANVRVRGGVRVTGIEVTSVVVAGNELTVTVDRAGDFSPYELQLVSSALDADVPDGFDPILGSIRFSFKANCPAIGDCRLPSPAAARTTPSEVPLDYLVRDYEGFRRLMLDRLATLLPNRRESGPADGLVTVVEALAHVADQFSYRLDAIGTEPYLGTARSRISVRRHARLLDYRLHDGSAARTWLCLQVRAGSGAEQFGLPVGTSVLSGTATIVVDPAALDDERRRGAIEFTTLAELHPTAARNKVPLHTWTGSRCCLPIGATTATVVDAGPIVLAAGDLVLLEEVRSPRTGLSVDADASHRHVVRLTSVTSGHDPVEQVDVLELEWAEDDALPFALSLTAQLDESGDPTVCAVARGNVVLAHHASPRSVNLGTVPPGRWRPTLTDESLACTESTDAAVGGPASRALQNDPRRAVPMVLLTEAGGGGTAVWESRTDLLGSDSFDRGVVVEIERDGRAQLRFGDDVHGRAPTVGVSFEATWWSGGGAVGNVGRNVLTRVVTDLDGILSVTNPLPAVGGTDPESMEQARQYAPAAFRVQERAVTTDDWVEVAGRLPEVQHAAARMTWTGSWWTVFLTLDLRGGRHLRDDPAREADLVRRLDRYRIAGYDLELRDPVDVPVHLKLSVCVDRSRLADEVRAAVTSLLSTHDFFHPDRFTFGQPLYLSEVIAAVADVAGVASVQVVAAHPVGSAPGNEVDDGLLTVGPFEVLRLDNNPSAAENGTLELVMEGGL